MGRNGTRLKRARGVMALAAAAICGLKASEPCRKLSDQDQTRLVSYVSKKYNVPDTLKLWIKDSKVVSDDCHRRLLFAGQGPLGVFTLTLYTSPDLRFLSPNLMDSYVDPIREREEEARKLMGELTQGEFASRGSANAPVTVVVFSDFQCPFCKQAAAALEAEPLIQTGTDVRLVFRHLPLKQHEWAQEAALAAACAEFQSSTAFWTFHDALFAEQQSIQPGDLSSKIRELAAHIPSLNQLRFRECWDRQMSLGAVLRDEELASRVGVTGTPTIFINGRISPGIGDRVGLPPGVRQTVKTLLTVR